MGNKRPSEIFGVIFVAMGSMAYISGYKFMGLVIWVIWYLLYGWVGLALYFFRHQKHKLSSAFIALTIPFTLMPFRRTWYYWVKSWNAASLKKMSQEKIWMLVEKVNPKYITSNKGKAGHYVFKAALSLDMKDKDKASMNIELARSYADDDEQVIEVLNKLEESLKG